ncbi:MAG: hypothetical protein ABI224_13245 [Acetobacteraceae bacterium]
MPLVRVSRADIDMEKLLADLAARPEPTEEEIDRQAAEDGGAWTEEDVAQAIAVYPPPTPEQVRALRARLGLSQPGSRIGSGSASMPCSNTSRAVGCPPARRPRCCG